MSGEGISGDLLNVITEYGWPVVTDPCHALDPLLNPAQLKATLRD